MFMGHAPRLNGGHVRRGYLAMLKLGCARTGMPALANPGGGGDEASKSSRSFLYLFRCPGSVTVTTRSPGTSRSDCLMPLGQVRSISLAAELLPSPKCTRGSLDDAYPVLVVA